MTHIQRLRRQCEPVQEDTPVPERGHGVRVDVRDLKQLLADYDAALLACSFAGIDPDNVQQAYKKAGIR